ncbi:MAG TPA: TetR/AcrR family transcriptional regulator [Gemmatimonadales bacterium]|nr:TetR/AcrR family transcriptional regulator [Gemmatimonadales bacterium]
MTTRGPYRLKRRAESQAETRLKIVAATVALHRTVGPAHTTISAIAARAGVQRLTVYRHFPDEMTLFTACSGHFLAINPIPDPAPWREIADPLRRLEVGLTALYGYFSRTGDLWSAVLRDAELHEPTRRILEKRDGPWREVRDALTEGFTLRGKRRKLVAAAVAHAVDFRTWQSLSDGGLASAQIVELMLAMVRGAGGER